jgi:hypothetical protein
MVPFRSPFQTWCFEGAVDQPRALPWAVLVRFFGRQIGVQGSGPRAFERMHHNSIVGFKLGAKSARLSVKVTPMLISWLDAARRGRFGAFNREACAVPNRARSVPALGAGHRRLAQSVRPSVTTIGKKKIKNHTNEAVRLLKTNKTLFLKGPYPVRFMKTSRLASASRYLTEITQLSSLEKVPQFVGFDLQGVICGFGNDANEPTISLKNKGDRFS